MKYPLKNVARSILDAPVNDRLIGEHDVRILRRANWPDSCQHHTNSAKLEFADPVAK